jgi:hypothetical protein
MPSANAPFTESRLPRAAPGLRKLVDLFTRNHNSESIAQRRKHRHKFLVERKSQYSELRNFGLFPCNQVGKAFLQVLFFAHRYLIGDNLFAALDFECGFLAHS